jgi:membrane protease YdiL (CAAX protease family)
LNSFPENPEVMSEPVLGPPAESRPTPPRDPAWSGWDVLRILLIALVALLVTVLVLAVVVPGSTFRDRLNRLNAQPELLMIGQMAAYLVLLGYMYILVTRERRQPRFWEAIHWHWPARIRIYLVGGFLMQAVFLLVERFLPFPKNTPFEALLQRPYSLFLIAAFSVTLGPLMEELFFRGFLYPVLKRRLGVMAAVVATALPFALMHAAQYGGAWASVLLIFVVGVVLAVVREKTNSLAASFLVHAAYNGTIIVLIFVTTGGFRHLERLSSQ